jgi:ABC-type antimicrobial peptide transport system permease subunit
MSETAFPINDLLRRKLQTGLTIISLTACVASTLFLLLFSDQIGLGITAVAQNTLTIGISTVFSQFLLFIGALIFTVGAVIVSFIVFLMMAQRTKDFGLMKATGCPNSLVFGYFLTELLGITFIGCLLGVALGFLTDYIVVNTNIFQAVNKTPNYWFAPVVFAAFFVFALVFGAKPLLNAAKMSPLKALSPIQYFGLGKGTALKPLSQTGLTIRIASRSLFRRKSATLRIVIFLSVVFLLLTVSIAGGIIANDTSTSWVHKAIGKDVILVANSDMANQYVQLLRKFSGAKENLGFNYSNPNLAIPDTVIQQLNGTQGVATVDTRLVYKDIITEKSSYTVDPETAATIPLGDNRKGESLIVGIEPEEIVSEPYTSGLFLNSTASFEAVVGDSIAKALYAPIIFGGGGGRDVLLADPLRESVIIQGSVFKITGVSLDPLNNGNVTYVPLKQLQNITGIFSPNVILVKVDASANYAATLAQIQDNLKTAHPEFTAVDFNQVLAESVNFLGSLWSVIMFLPAFALVAATLCLISYHMLTIDEQHQEFAVLRATGAKPCIVIMILSVQSLIILLSSFGVGISLGTITTLLILTTNPVVSELTVLAISAWLLAALLGMFLLSLYPALKFARKPLLQIMS